MTATSPSDIESRVVRRRVTLSALAMVAIFVAPLEPILSGRVGLFLAFFLLGVVAVGWRDARRRMLVIIVSSLALSLGVVIAAAPANANLYVLQAAYLGTVGYLVAYLGQQWMRRAAVEQRTQIARDLHDGCLQTLAAINLRLATCQELLRRRRTDEALADLDGLQASINVENDGLRAYMRSLAGLPPTPLQHVQQIEPRFSVRAEFSGSGALVDQVLQIIREGVSNVRRHAGACAATIDVRAVGSEVSITIGDDGVGFRSAAERPWTIASRVSELGGLLRVTGNGPRGTRLEVRFAEG